MALTLTIENFAQLPDGGPLSITVPAGRGIDIGRDTYLDWTLPDPDMFISGKHCEIRSLDGVFWLYDVSLNGTYLEGAASRLPEPHRLQHGDRLVIGRYIIAVTLDGEPSAPRVERPASPDNIWDFAGEVPAPIDPRELRPMKPRPDTADFLDWAIESPEPIRDTPAPMRPESPSPVDSEDFWLPPPPAPSVPPPPPRVPEPDRPVWQADESTEVVLPTRAVPPVAPPARAAEPPAPPPLAPEPPAAARPTPRVAGQPRPFDTPREVSAIAPSDFVARFAAAAGLPVETLGVRDAGELAELLGTLVGIVTDEMWRLLEARRETKRMARCSDPTMTQADNNNPLKFAPTPQDALRQMLGPANRAFLSACPALRQGFADLERHQVDTLSAMQGAVRMLIEDLDPRDIERAQGADHGIAAMLGTRKAKLWDAYVERWRAKERPHHDGMLGAYMDYFARCYDRNVAERT